MGNPNQKLTKNDLSEITEVGELAKFDGHWVVLNTPLKNAMHFRKDGPRWFTAAPKGNVDIESNSILNAYIQYLRIVDNIRKAELEAVAKELARVLPMLGNGEAH